MFPALVGEFGSTLDSTSETDCMSSILAYMNGADATSPVKHAQIDSFFYWCAASSRGVLVRWAGVNAKAFLRQDSMRAPGLVWST